MKWLKKKWNVLCEVAFVTYKEWSAYRTHSMVSILVGPIFFAVQYFIWSAVYGEGGTLNGMELPQIIRYYGASALLGYLTMDFADWNLSMLIRTGKYLTFSLRPIHHRFFAFSQKIGHRFLGFIFEFLPCLCIFVFVFRIDMKPAYPVWTVVSVLLAFLMQFYINYCLGLFSFWIVDSTGLRNAFFLLSSVFSGSLIPLVFFPEWLQKAQFFLPFQYITYVPVMVFTGQYSLGGFSLTIPTIIGYQTAAVLIMVVLSEALYRNAMKHFSGVGA